MCSFIRCITLPFLIVLSSATMRAQQLLPIVENGLSGFINPAGIVIIKPRFRSVGMFSEGLAPVRLNGRYGYIDSTGAFVIQPRFDHALPFREGIAAVVVNSKPFIIGRDGAILFEHNYAAISPLRQGLAIVTTKNDCKGVVDVTGRLVVDTLYGEIEPFSEGRAVVTGQDNSAGGAEKPEVGVVDRMGNLIVPFGTYHSIKQFREGLSEVRLIAEDSKWGGAVGYINLQGDQVFLCPKNKYYPDYHNGHFSEGRAVISLYENDPDAVEYSETYSGIIDATGAVVFAESSFEQITPFREGRAFGRLDPTGWVMIDRNGNRIGDSLYTQVKEEGFHHGLAFVMKEHHWIAIDSLGREVARMPDVYTNTEYANDGILYFQWGNIGGEDTDGWGCWDPKNGVYIAPKYDRINDAGFQYGLLAVVEDGRSGYIDSADRYVWRESVAISTPALETLNIDFMTRGYFYASSPYKKELAGYGGWGESGNAFVEVTDEDFKSDALSMEVRSEKDAVFAEKFRGMKLYVANTSDHTFLFNAQDSRLYLKLQARDENGEWRDIEYLPSSWCGNSYHKLFLPPDAFWSFTIPVYEGEFHTSLRAELRYLMPDDEEDAQESVLYSNEFQGGINPGQLWRKLGYSPAGIMDPYSD